MKIGPSLGSIGAIVAALSLVASAYAQQPAATAPVPAPPNSATEPAPPAQNAPTEPAPPAQSAPTEPAPPPQATAPSAPAPAEPVPSAAPAARALTQAQLDQLLAPIALYPDTLLGQVLMASTYPLEVVAAARWVSAPANRALKGDALVDALKARKWDPSVMALVPFPRLLQTMSSKIEWTERLGDAVLAQEADVMASVQRLRRLAMDAGNLQTPKCQCVAERKGDIVTIQPANQQVAHVPVCIPRRVYGAWPYPDYPPVSFPVPPGYAFAPGGFFGFDRGVELAYYGPLWGWSSIDWGGRAIGVDPVGFAVLAGTAAVLAGNHWVHNPAHRGWIGYRDRAVGARFDAARGVALGATGPRGRGGFAAAGVVAMHGRGVGRGGRHGGGVAVYRSGRFHASGGYGKGGSGWHGKGRSGWHGKGGGFGGGMGHGGGKSHFAGGDHGGGHGKGGGGGHGGGGKGGGGHGGGKGK